MRIVRWTLGIAYIGLGASAAAAGIAHLLNPAFGIGSFPPDVVVGIGVAFAIVGGYWLFPSVTASAIVRVLGILTGIVVGALGLWGTTIVWFDFCSSGPADSSAGGLASSVPGGVECLEALPSLLIGGWMISVGVLSLSAFLLDRRFGDRIDADPALD